MAVVPNPMRSAGVEAGPMPTAPRELHRRLPGYLPTALHSSDDLASELGVAEVLVKDESERFGLPAFKILGASWASYLVLQHRRSRPFDPWQTIGELRAQVADLGPLTLATATDGNHGRAVARVAAWLGLSSRICVPEGTVAARIDAIAGEGADVTITPGGYDGAVAEVAAWASDDTLVVSDTSWEGYTEPPVWIIDGYSTVFAEIDEQLAEQGRTLPNVVFVPVGVGAFIAAVVTRFRQPDAAARTARIVAIEPVDAACVLASAQAGRVVTLDGEQHSIMAGLNCATPSLVAWPRVSAGTDFFVTVTDYEAQEAMRALASVGIVSGESGAASLAGAWAMASAGELGPDDRLLLLSTEGATDPAAYDQIVTSRRRH